MPGLLGSSGETGKNTAIPIREMPDKKGDKNSMKIRIINPQAAGRAEEILFEADSVSADPGGRRRTLPRCRCTDVQPPRRESVWLSLLRCEQSDYDKS